MIKIFFLTFFTLALLQTTLFSQTINIDSIVKNAYAHDKKVIVYLHRIGCSYCNSMQEFTLEEDDVVNYIQENFKLISINVTLKDTIIYKGKTTGGSCFAKNIGYAFYPSTLFLDKEGKIFYSSLGYKNEYEFLIILEYINKGFKNKMSLKEYKKSIGYEEEIDSEIKDSRIHVR